MAKTEESDKAGNKTPRKPGKEKSGPETAEVAFDDIIDAILNADPGVVRDTKRQRKKISK
jgi:hypothetical protein